MPNHCETDMYIKGAKDDVSAFAKWLEEIEGMEICCALIPYPVPYGSKAYARANEVLNRS